MMKFDNPKIDDYLQALCPERKRAVSVQRKLILDPIPGAEESLRYKKLTNDAAVDFLAAVAYQKHYLSFIENNELIAARKFELAHLNCGKNCIRLKGFDNLPVETVWAILQEATEEQFDPIEMGLIFAKEPLSTF